MSEKTFKTYEVSYHIINKANVQAKTKEEAAVIVCDLSRERLLDGSTLSIQHIWEADVDTATETELAERGVRLSPKDLPATDEEFPLGSL
jgi:hypothetical protein